MHVFEKQMQFFTKSSLLFDIYEQFIEVFGKKLGSIESHFQACVHAMQHTVHVLQSRWYSD